jgi:hypothetical protein
VSVDVPGLAPGSYSRVGDGRRAEGVKNPRIIVQLTVRNRTLYVSPAA